MLPSPTCGCRRHNRIRFRQLPSRLVGIAELILAARRVPAAEFVLAAGGVFAQFVLAAGRVPAEFVLAAGRVSAEFILMRRPVRSTEHVIWVAGHCSSPVGSTELSSSSRT